jgi:glycosyltransferase involved in cell wall biosynthesis
VIVPAYNAAGRIERCLRALEHQSLVPHEVIVVDDGSGDATAAVARELGVRVIRQPNAGPAAARNTGAKAASGELLLFTDDDCAPTPTWVSDLAAPFADPEVVGAKGTYSTTQSAPVARWVQLEYEEKYARMAGRERIDFIDTYSAAYRKRTFLDAGGFDESFPTATVEDQEFSFRLAERGLKMVFAPGAVVAHEHPTTLHEYFKRKYFIGVWKPKVLERFPAKAVEDDHTPQTLKLQVLLAGIVTALAPVLPLSRRARRVSLVAAGGFAASSLPMMGFAASRDPRLIPLIPAFLLIRALGLGLGLVRSLALRQA